ncbi:MULTISPECIES: hypothetical protein [unclassified Parabacteroides]|uniref:hypothetical protein n=1 Tax=unclassified Parabacteroides TaxID=2649774 RepID=UPI002475CA69|nr:MULTISPECIES: hypothetical protein [unclassified Parabacteroides]
MEVKKLSTILPELTKSSSGTLQKESPGGLLRTDNGCEISLYGAGELKPNEIAVEMARLRTAFPKQSQEFFNLLAERVLKNNFSPERLRDAVNHTIDNFAYKELNVSDIIRFDRRAKLYTYGEVCRLVMKGEADFSDFKTKEVEGEVFRVKKSDLL